MTHPARLPPSSAAQRRHGSRQPAGTRGIAAATPVSRHQVGQPSVTSLVLAAQTAARICPAPPAMMKTEYGRDLPTSTSFTLLASSSIRPPRCRPCTRAICVGQGGAMPTGRSDQAAATRRPTAPLPHRLVAPSTASGRTAGSATTLSCAIHCCSAGRAGEEQSRRRSLCAELRPAHPRCIAIAAAADRQHQAQRQQQPQAAASHRGSPLRPLLADRRAVRRSEDTYRTGGRSACRTWEPAERSLPAPVGAHVQVGSAGA